MSLRIRADGRIEGADWQTPATLAVLGIDWSK